MNDVLVEKGSVTVDSILKPVEATAFSSHVSGVLPTGYLDQDGVLHKSIDIGPFFSGPIHNIPSNCFSAWQCSLSLTLHRVW